MSSKKGKWRSKRRLRWVPFRGIPLTQEARTCYAAYRLERSTLWNPSYFSDLVKYNTRHQTSLYSGAPDPQRVCVPLYNPSEHVPLPNALTFLCKETVTAHGAFLESCAKMYATGLHPRWCFIHSLTDMMSSEMWQQRSGFERSYLISVAAGTEDDVVAYEAREYLARRRKLIDTLAPNYDITCCILDWLLV
jgi:hypothetical protein